MNKDKTRSNISRDRIRVLSFLQEAISRMDRDGQKTKIQWIFLSFFLGLLMILSGIDVQILWVVEVFISLFFWLITARYLYIERGFRDTYDETLFHPEDKLTMFLIRPNKNYVSFMGCIFSFSVLMYPAAIVIYLVILFLH